jgi:hypothetical protein
MFGGTLVELARTPSSPTRLLMMESVLMAWATACRTLRSSKGGRSLRMKIRLIV